MAGSASGDVVIRIRVDDKLAGDKLRRLATDLEKVGQKGGGVAAAKGLTDISVSSESANIGLLKLSGALGTAMVAASLITGVLTEVASTCRDVATYAAEAAIETVRVADEFEKLHIRLAVLRGGSEQADEAMAWIRQFAMDTPYQVEAISRAAVTLESFGLKFENNVKAVGDAAAMMDMPIEHAAELFGRFSVGLFNTRFLAQLGLSQKKLKEWGIAFDASGSAIGSATDNYEKFIAGITRERGDLMVKTMETVSGKVSNLSDYFNEIKAQVGDELLPVVKSFLDMVMTAFAEIRTSGELADAASILADVFADNRDLLLDIVGLIPSIADGIATAIGYAATLIDYLATLNETTVLIGTNGTSAIDNVGGAIRMLLRGVIAVIEYFKSWVDLMKEMAVIDWKNPVESLKAISKITLPGMFVDMARAFERADAALNAIDEKRSEKWFERQREIRERDKREWPEKWKRMREPAGGLYTGGGWRETGAAGGVGGTERSDRVAVLQERIKRAQEQYEDRVKRAEELAEAFAEVEEKLREVDELLAKTIESTNRRLAAGIRGGIEAGFDEGWAGVGTWFLGRLKTGVLQAVEDALTQAFAARMVRESLSQIPIIGPFLGLLGFQSGGIIKGGRGGVPAIIGEGRSSEIVQPVTPQGITNLVRGISGAIKFPDMAPTFLFQGLDPRDVKVAQRVDRGWRTVLAETW